MSIIPFNFSEQTISADGLAAVLRSVLTDGPLHGCGVSYSDATVSVAPGRIIIGGYVFLLSSSASVSVPVSSNVASVVIRLDLSNDSTPSSFEQIDIRAEAGSYTPVREDLDGSGSVYELVMARVSISGGVISGVTYTAPAAHRAVFAQRDEPENAKPGDVWLVMPS